MGLNGFEMNEREPEEWQSAIGYEGFYDVSSHGRVRSLIKRNNQGTISNREVPLIRKLNINSDGYTQLCLSKNSIDKTVSTHTLVAKAFVPNPLNLPEVNHLDGDKTNSYYKNLEWTDRSGNVKHAYDSGLKPKMSGERSGMAKLTNEQVLEIFNSEENPKTLCLKYGINWSVIYKIKSGETWSGVTGKELDRKSKRLSEELVIKIYTSSKPQYQIAEEFGVTRSLVCLIKQKKVYSKITNKFL